MARLVDDCVMMLGGGWPSFCLIAKWEMLRDTNRCVDNL